MLVCSSTWSELPRRQANQVIHEASDGGQEQCSSRADAFDIRCSKHTDQTACAVHAHEEVERDLRSNTPMTGDQLQA